MRNSRMRLCGMVNTVFSVALKNSVDMVCLAGCEASLPYDFLIKCIGKGHVNYSTNMLFPLFDGQKQKQITLRSLLLNCLTCYYAPLWKQVFEPSFIAGHWSKADKRLSSTCFSSLTSDWTWATPLRTDYERRQALVEIDVLTAMALGMTLDQLKTIYRIQFPVLQSYEADTWYDANGRIVFTTNRSLTGVGFDRKTWETEVKGAPAGRSSIAPSPTIPSPAARWSAPSSMSPRLTGATANRTMRRRGRFSAKCKEVTMSKFIDTLMQGAGFISEAVHDSIYEAYKQELDTAYQSGMATQLRRDINSVAQMLVALGNDDGTIYSLLAEYFKLDSIHEAKCVVLNARKSVQIKKLRLYYESKGLSLSFREYAKQHSLEQKLTENPKLLSYTPEKLMAAIEKE